MKKEKLKVSSEMKEALDLVREENNYNIDEILECHVDKNSSWSGYILSHLNNLSISQMAHALYAGYEKEKTPEEKALNYYNFLPVDCKETICTFLSILDYKVKGINIK